MRTEFYRKPPDYLSYINKLFSLERSYPFLRVFPIGKSVLSRTIYALGFGNLSRVNLLAGAFHAQEWLTCSVLVHFAEDICRTIKRGEEFEGVDFERTLKQKGILIVPMVNPDGVEIALHGPKSAKHLQKFVTEIQLNSDRSWQANANGVDLNHNYDAGFSISRNMETAKGITGPSPRQYGGGKPHSEPENKAIIRLCEKYDVRTAFALHSQGEEIYYEYGRHTPLISRYMASLFASCCGYTVAKPEGLASHAGFKDWFIETYHRPGFTFEIGRGENPLPITDLPDVYEKLAGTLAVASVL